MHLSNSLMHRPAKRFLLVDDHPIMSDALRYTLETVAPDSKVEFAASYGEARRLLAEGNRIDCILLDLGLPDSDGYDALQGLRLLRPDTPVVVLSADGERDTIMRCLNLGAQGFIPKTVHHDVLRYALQMVAAGHMYVPKEVVTNTGWTPANALSRVQPARATSRDPRSLGLTGRQCDVLRLILRGLPNKLICRELDLAEGTVKIHVSAVLRALGARNRTQAVIAANQLGLKLATEPV
ncbi:MAG: response regulator transcription factor [Betaproteobacteria bacterium]|nr:response regulator transcription factor [Betaproteobacteria bacterium]